MAKTIYLTGDKVGVKKMTAYIKRHHPNIKVLTRNSEVSGLIAHKD